MTVWYKQGVLGDLQPVARKGLGHLARMFEDYDRDMFVTSLRDGNHSAGSLHYDGLAFDIKNGPVHVSTIKSSFGLDWDVVDEKTHIHCEYDPK